ncbi:MAG: AAA family ATPase [Chloroflexota bacterium]|nr:AAA family ATPase [Chloroflexota bacterium]
MAERQPRILLVDELDKMAAADMGALLSLMEGGRLVRAKVGRRLNEQVELWVVAATNNLRVLAPELLSRLAVRRLHAYTRTEFREVVRACWRTGRAWRHPWRRRSQPRLTV